MDEQVILPHCWNTQDTFLPDKKHYQGYGSYKRILRLEKHFFPSDTRWILHAEGFYGTGDVWIDGTKIGRVDGQYLGFDLDLNDCVRPEQSHLLAIRLDNRYHRGVLPGHRMPDFILYGGLVGGLWLIREPDLCLQKPTLQITCSDPLATVPQLDLACQVFNRLSRPAKVQLHYLLRDDSQQIVQTGETTLGLLPSGQSFSWEDSLRIEHPRLWELDDPHLYDIQISLHEENALVDRITQRYGLRSSEFKKGQGFFLNGQRLLLRGCNRHESIPGLGSALPPDTHRMDAEVIKRSGFNLVRLSHYPQSRFFMDACDEMGLLVYSEVASWKSVRRGSWLRAACRQMETMIRRDRNRPSVILWGMGNEARSRKAYQVLQSLIKDLDPTRPTTYAEHNLTKGNRARTLRIPDLLSVNYDIRHLDEALQGSRAGCVLISELANFPHAARGELELELVQVSWFEEYLRHILHEPGVAGYALWLFADYATERKNRNYRFSGVVDAWRVPKMSADWHAAISRRDAFLKLHGDWEIRDDPAPRSSFIFTNCERVDLFRDETLYRSLESPVPFFHQIPFEPVDLVAKGMKFGEIVESRLVPFDKARQVSLRAKLSAFDVVAPKTITLDLFVVDSKGRHVPTFKGSAQVQIEGPVRCNTCSEGGVFPLAGGIGRTFLICTGDSGTIRIRGHSEGLLSDEITVQI